jgi:hypothetical protein
MQMQMSKVEKCAQEDRRLLMRTRHEDRHQRPLTEDVIMSTSVLAKEKSCFDGRCYPCLCCFNFRNYTDGISELDFFETVGQ